MLALFCSILTESDVSLGELVQAKVKPAQTATTAAYIRFFFIFYSLKEKCRFYPALSI
jgi:hypothetical protein